MNKAITLSLVLGAMLWAQGTIGPNPWWIKANSTSTDGWKFRGVCAINDYLVWVVGEGGRVYKRTGGVHSHSWVSKAPSGAINNYDFNDVCFVDGAHGWIVGEGCQASNKYEGVIYCTSDSGENWSNQTGNVWPTLTLPTPFLRVKMVQVGSYYHGYIACGNGKVLRTTNSGTDWYHADSPWSTNKDSISVWYNGLSVDSNYPDTLWVSGDAFGILAKSTDGGQTWTAYQDSMFKQSYTFPPSTVPLCTTRLANFDLCFSNVNNGEVALSYGKIGKTTNGGTAWDTARYEPQATWFYDVINNGTDNLTGGNYGVAHRFNGTHEQENVNYRWKLDDYTTDFASLDAHSATYAYGVGKGEVNIRQRYDPGNFHYDSTRIIDDSLNSKYEIRLFWTLSGANNVHQMHVEQYRVSYFHRRPASIQVWNLDHPCGTLTDFIPYGDKKAHYYYTIDIVSYDQVQSNYYRQECHTVGINATDWDNLVDYTPPSAPAYVNAIDVSNDQGHQIDLTWGRVGGVDDYYIGRAINAAGPYYNIGKTDDPDTTFTDTTAQNDVRYYYRVVSYVQSPDYNPSGYSPYGDTFATDNTKPSRVPRPSDSLIYLQNDTLIRLTWNPPSPDSGDIAGYWVCPALDAAEGYNVYHASPIDRRIYYVPVEDSWLGQWVYFYVSAMDYSGQIGDWSYPCSVHVQLVVDTTSSKEALAFNNAKHMARSGNDFWCCYESDGTVCAKKSTDAGKTWSSRTQIGQGYNPCICLKPGALGPSGPTLVLIWWAKDTNDTLYYKKYSSGSWDASPTVIVTSSDDFSPPSLALETGNWGHVVYEEDSVIRYTEFPLGIGFQVTDSVGTGANPSIGYMSSSGNPEIHVAWESGTRLYYRSKSGGTWNSREYILANGKRACLEVVGSGVHVVCEKGDDIYHCETYYVEGEHDWSSERILNTSNASTLPVITGGDVCVWVENVGGSNKEIVYSWNSLTGWSGADTISETSECSDYPHIVHKQTLDTTRVYCIWTENDSKPYDILFKSFWVGEGGSFDDGDPYEEPDMPFYIVECGESEPSAFNLRREGYTQYGAQYYNRIDYDSEYLEYKFEGLDPDREYALSAHAYHQGDNNLQITVNVENVEIGRITVPASTPIECREMVPLPLYKDGIAYVTIHGEKAVSAAFVLYEYEKESGKGGGPQDTKVTPLKVDRLALNVFPNPVRKDISVQYIVPRKMRVKLSIYDVAGRLTRTLINSTQKPGSYQQTFTTANLSQGVYFVRLHTSDKSIVEKVIFLR